ncbi:MAG: hypothetical protein AAFX93_19725 [Verrucomicrobiota bacterium]
MPKRRLPRKKFNTKDLPAATDTELLEYLMKLIEEKGTDGLNRLRAEVSPESCTFDRKTIACMMITGD